MELSDGAIITRLRQAQRMVVLTGGGLAAESGFPTFAQSQTGSWAHYAVSELATPQAFVRNPRLVWQWYAHRRMLAAQGHAAFLAKYTVEQIGRSYTQHLQALLTARRA